MTDGTQATLTSGNGPLAATEAGKGTGTAAHPPDTGVGTVYLIQERTQIEDAVNVSPEGFAWRDVGQVTVPKRSSLKTVFDAALEELQELRPTQSSGPMRLRAVQPENVAEWEALLEVPPAPEPQIVVRPVG